MVDRRLLSLSVAALFAGLSVQMPSAHAGLLDVLFGGGPRKASRSEFPPQPASPGVRKQKPKASKVSKAVKAPIAAKPKNRRAAVAITPIASPSYYTYQPRPLQKVDLQSTGEIVQPVAAGPSTAGPFTEALASAINLDVFAEGEIAEALMKHYAEYPAFLWVSGLDANQRSRDAIRTLGEAGSYGLSPADYSVAVPSAGSDPDASRLESLLRFEVALSARVLRYVRDAQGGRIDPNRISGYYDFAAKPVDLEGALNAISHTREVGEYLRSRHPQNAQYQALRVELEALEASAENDILLDPKLLLKPGETSAELPNILRLIERGAGGHELPADLMTRLGTSEIYVDELVEVVKRAQERAGLKGDGVIGPRTVKALSGTSRADRMQKVVVALEQLRWHPSDLGSPRVFINQPAFTASYIEGDTETLTMRAVIGRPENQTSFFHDEIEQVDYNPYWGVPQSILVNEMLPRLRRDPGYLDRSGYEVTDSKGKRISSSAVSWGRYGAKIPFSVRQTPSEANALGELKILFPNKHAIYMHDTPSKDLFERDERAFSHGCVRLHDPRGMAAAVLGSTAEHVAEKIAKGHSSEKVTRKIPVYVAYFTAWPDSTGKVSYYGDVYGREARLMDAMARTDAVRNPNS